MPDSVQERCPEDLDLRKLGIESYVGILFRDASGEPLGHLGIIHDRPLKPETRTNPLFHQLAHYSSMEMRRCSMEQERLELERHMLTLQKEESLGVLAGGIAHDFNNLLTSILGNAELAAIDLPSDHPARELLSSAGQAAAQAADLCRQLFVYAGRAEVRSGTIELKSLVRTMTSLLKVSVPKNCRFRNAPSDGKCATRGTRARCGRSS